uniref:Secreted in xylem 9 n=1 Tax=Fusarium oxysporum f. sp. sesami TaxID=654397 RepID=A0A6G6A8N5_FUSOX|nr:secreted in xylem 9 [Fusarium oxysporum f. sp. sesami]
MKHSAIVAMAFAIFPSAEAQHKNIQVGCYAVDSRQDGLLPKLLFDAAARGRADPDLRFGFWDAGNKICCTSPRSCGRYYAFTYNHPYNWASKTSTGTIDGQNIKFTCVGFSMGQCTVN